MDETHTDFSRSLPHLVFREIGPLRINHEIKMKYCVQAFVIIGLFHFCELALRCNVSVTVRVCVCSHILCYVMSYALLNLAWMCSTGVCVRAHVCV